MNRSRSTDPVDEALASLGADHGHELPDPRIERRLVRLAERRLEGRSTRRPPALARLATLAAGCVVLLGGSLWAAGGVEGLRRWWYSIRVGDERVAGAIDGDGRRAFEFTTPDGYAVHVLIERTTAPGGARTQVAVREDGDAGRSEEVWQFLEGAPELGAGRRPLALLGDAEPLHRWTDELGRERELYLVDAPHGSGDWLVVRDLAAPPDVAVRVVQPVARSIGAGGRVALVERADGTLAIELADGRGWVCELELSRTARPEPAPTELSTPSGRVHVELGADD